MARPKNRHLMHTQTGKFWCGKRFTDQPYSWSYNPELQYCGICLRRLLEALQEELDGIEQRARPRDGAVAKRRS